MLVSQGERHKGNLAIVRDVVSKYVNIFKNIRDDFLADMLLHDGLPDPEGKDVDKKDQKTWKNAIYFSDETKGYAKTGGLYCPKRKEVLEEVFNTYQKIEQTK